MTTENRSDSERMIAAKEEAVYGMSKADIHNIQRSLNIIRAELAHADAQTRLQALELMTATSQSVIAAARKLTKPKMVFAKPKPLPILKPSAPSAKPQKQAKKPAPKPDLSPKEPVPPVG